MSDPDFRITWGQDFNYFNKIHVTRTVFGDLNDGYRCDIMIPFSTFGISFLNESPTYSAMVEISFDGIHVHDQLGISPLLTFVAYENRVVSKAWFRVTDGYADVSIRAWSIR